MEQTISSLKAAIKADIGRPEIQIYSIVKLLFTFIGSFTYTQNVLYMMFVVSCIHSLETQLETKRFGNKRKSLQLQEVFLCAAH